jgi:hypothetical protein
LCWQWSGGRWLQSRVIAGRGRQLRLGVRVSLVGFTCTEGGGQRQFGLRFEVTQRGGGADAGGLASTSQGGGRRMMAYAGLSGSGLLSRAMHEGGMPHAEGVKLLGIRVLRAVGTIL